MYSILEKGSLNVRPSSHCYSATAIRHKFVSAQSAKMPMKKCFGWKPIYGHNLFRRHSPRGGDSYHVPSIIEHQYGHFLRSCTIVGTKTQSCHFSFYSSSIPSDPSESHELSAVPPLADTSRIHTALIPTQLLMMEH